MATRWTHITINCRDIDASVDFYTSFCGLSIVRDRRLEGRHNVWLGPPAKAGEDPVFVLVIVEDEVKARLDHFGFQCDSRAEVDRIAEQHRRTVEEKLADLTRLASELRRLSACCRGKGLIANCRIIEALSP